MARAFVAGVTHAKKPNRKSEPTVAATAEVLLIEDLAPRVGVKGGAIVFGQQDVALPSTPTRGPNDKAKGSPGRG
jgi:hypothetical protein